MAVQFPAELQSVRFRQSLSLWERWHGASRDGEGEVASPQRRASAGSRRCKCRLPLAAPPVKKRIGNDPQIISDSQI